MSDGSTTLTDEPEPAGAFSVTSYTHVGCVRSENQDSCWDRLIDAGAALVVADGMGGHKGGASASREAIRVISAGLETGEAPTDQSMKALFSDVAEAVAAAAPEGGTTLVVAILSARHIDVWHIGDSRAYVMRSGTLTRITADHSWVHGLVERGKLSEAQAMAHPRRNVLLRAIGKGRDATPDHSTLRLVRGDLVLLCSDGLHGLMFDHEIATALAAGGRLDEIAKKLVRTALDRGAPDNVTVALASFNDNEPEGITAP